MHLPHIPTSLKSTKWLAYCLTSALLVLGALVVHPDRYPQLAISLVTAMGAFSGANTLSGVLGPKPATAPVAPAKPDAEEGS